MTNFINLYTYLFSFSILIRLLYVNEIIFLFWTMCYPVLTVRFSFMNIYFTI